MTHAIHGLLREGDRIDATDGQVPGVEAPVHVAGVENAVHVVLRLDEGLHVRVQHLLESMLGADLVDDPEHLDHVSLLRGDRGAGPTSRDRRRRQ